MTVSKAEFVKKAQNLQGSYFDYGCTLYMMSKQCGILEEVATYLFNSAKRSFDLDEKVYELMGNPEPLTVEVAVNNSRLVCA